MTKHEDDPCAHCEEMMQPYIDHILTEAERVEAEHHLDECEWCRRRYRFEESLRVYVRQVVTEPMSAKLRQKLSELRIPLNYGWCVEQAGPGPVKKESRLSHNFQISPATALAKL